MESLAVEYFIVGLSLLFSAFFSGIEVAFISANELKIEIENQKGSFYSKLIRRLFQQQDKCITTMLIGNNISLVIYGIFIEKILRQYLFPEYLYLKDMPFWGILIQTLISTFIILISAEFYPKVIFRIYANTVLKFFAIPIYLMYVIFDLLYINQIVFYLSNAFIYLLGSRQTTPVEKNKQYNVKDLSCYLRYYLNRIKEKDDIQINYLQNAIEMKHLKVRDCMIPRNEIVAVPKDTDSKILKKLFLETHYSRILVYKESIDEIIGFIHIIDLFNDHQKLHSIEFFPESAPVQKALTQLLKNRRSVGVVIDEYGGISGMFTIEDILEELVGEIEDEHDDNDLVEKRLSEKEYLFSGRLDIKYLNEKYQLYLPQTDDFDTIGGWMIYLFQDIPNQGVSIKTNDYIFTAEKVSSSKIELLRLQIK